MGALTPADVTARATAVADAERRELERLAWLAVAVRVTIWAKDGPSIDELLGRGGPRGREVSRAEHDAAWRDLWVAVGGDPSVGDFWGPEQGVH